ncbi:MAG: hypothetical protein ABI036_11965 [Fibrobacteria bacterium]
MINRQEYQALPGRVSGPMYSARLYQSRHHLLKSTVMGFHEHFRRFAWEDIQAIIIQETPWNGVMSLLLSLVFLMQAVSFLTFSDKAMVTFLIYLPFLILIGALLAVNLSRGPTCKTFLLTSVTRERLWSLNRVRKARELIDAVAPIILARQAEAGAAQHAAPAPSYPGEEITFTAAPASPPGASPAESQAHYPGGSAPKAAESGRWHLLALLFLAFAMMGNIFDLLLSEANPWLDRIGMICFLGSCATCVAVLISQTRKVSPRAVRVFGMILLGYHILEAMLIFGILAFGVILAVKHADLSGEIFEARKMFWFYPLVRSELAVETAVFLFGAIIMGRYLKRRSVETDASGTLPATEAT